MMRLWVRSYAQRTSIAPVATMSVGAHMAIIAIWVLATMPVESLPRESIANRVYYIPPPDKVPGGPPHEVVHYVSVDAGAGFGAGVRTMGNEKVRTRDESVELGRSEPTPSTPQAPPSPGNLEDSVFTLLDVDTAVVRASNSAAPAYPLKLLRAHVTGMVAAQYVVDTTGFADTTSFRVLSSTNPEFVAAVREALPNMRFSPAKIGSLKVRQLVEQQFSFKINDTTVVAPQKRTKRP